MVGELANLTTTRAGAASCSRAQAIAAAAARCRTSSSTRVWRAWPRRAPGRELLRAVPLRRPRAARGRRRAPRAARLPGAGRLGRATTPTCRCASPAPTPSACRDAELVELDGAGHWPWLDRPERSSRVARFLGALGSGTASALYNPRAMRVARLEGQSVCFPRGSLDAGLPVLPLLPRLQRLPGGARDHRLRHARRVRQRRPRDRPRELARRLLRARLPAGADRTTRRGWSTSRTSCT